MNITLRQLRYLVAVAETCHFGRAAEACFVSQPALSTQIQALEEALGASLIERTRQNVFITPLGEQIVERARRVLGEVEDLCEQAHGGADTLGYNIRLGVIPTLSPYVLPEVLPALREAYPELPLILREDKTEILLAQLRGGKLDMAFLALPIDGQDLYCVEVADDPFVLAAPASHSLMRNDTLDANDLVGQDVMLLEDGHCLRDQALDVCRLRGAREDEKVQASSLGTLTQMVASGMGITLLPAVTTRVETLGAPQLSLRQFAEPIPTRKLGFAWRATTGRADEFNLLAMFFREHVEQLIRKNIANV
ncbi:MAG: LysR substrate-binding domain-containing protein [Pseudomonadota bacterium]